MNSQRESTTFFRDCNRVTHILGTGSEETHEKMTETAVKFNEKLSKRGKRLGELSREEFTDLIREASGK